MIRLLRSYQYWLSPWIGYHCRFIPTCSHYAIEAIEFKGICRGSYLMIKRLLRCHPWSQGGYDPVPTKTKGSA